MVVGTAVERDQPGGDEGGAGGDGERRGRPLVRLVVARQDERQRAEHLGERHGGGGGERPRAQSTSARTLSPESSAFGMKPRAPQAEISSP